MNILNQMGIQQWSLRQESTQNSDGLQSQPAEQYSLGWNELHGLVESGAHCECCKKYGGILGSGDEAADFIFIVDAPNEKGFETQQLISGREGVLFDAILQSIGMSRENCYLSSVRKCLSKNNLKSSAGCGTLIHSQIELVNAKVALTFGEPAAQAILRSNDNLDSIRKNDKQYSTGNMQIVNTYSLRQMLDKPELKAQVWQDLKKCLTYL